MLSRQVNIFVDIATAILPNPLSLKRRYEPSQYDELDSENLDPGIFGSPTKKNKTVETFKPSKFRLNTISRPIHAMKSPLGKPLHVETPAPAGSLKRKSTDTITPEDGGKSSKVARQTESAPVPSGRSPKSKRIGILSRRRMSSSPFTRVNPPSYSDTQHDLPFSIDAALSGTVSSYKKKIKQLDGSVPNAWVFDIYENTEEETNDIILEHSALVLDISDDEGINNVKNGRGKENIPPSDAVSAMAPVATVPVSRKNMMTDEPRTPLGDLNASEFYAEGCDANSFIEIPAENSEEADVEKADVEQAVAGSKSEESPASATANAAYELGDGWKNLIAQVKAATKAAVADDASYTPLGDVLDNQSEIEIWESESAKAEDEAPVSSEGLFCQA